MNKSDIEFLIINYINSNQRIFNMPNDLNPKTVLFGAEACIDSLQLVHLVVGIEKEMRKKGYLNLSLTNIKSFSLKHSPFQNIETFANFIFENIQ